MTTHKCYGCPVTIADEPGNYYCDACVAEQTREQASELRAFDALHRFADAVASDERKHGA